MLYFNGFVIQALYSDEYSQNYEGYDGTGRYVSWPLEWEEDDISKELTDEANNRWFYYTYLEENNIEGDSMLNTVGDLNYLNRYIEHCNSLGINIRILQIQSTRKYPIFEEKIKLKGKVLGYDYSSGGSFTSLLREDLDGNFEGEFLIFKEFYEKLNNSGLIDNIEDIKKYVVIREKLIDKGINLEVLGAMLIMLLADVTKEYMNTYFIVQNNRCKD